MCRGIAAVLVCICLSYGQLGYCVCFVCGLTSQSTAMVMSRWSNNLTTLFLGNLRLSGLPVVCAHTFAWNLQLGPRL